MYCVQVDKSCSHTTTYKLVSNILFHSKGTRSVIVNNIDSFQFDSDKQLTYHEKHDVFVKHHAPPPPESLGVIGSRLRPQSSQR